MNSIKRVSSRIAVGVLAVTAVTAVSGWGGSARLDASPARTSPMAVTPAVAGTPQAPTLVWRENFENGMGTQAWALNFNGVKYTGTSGQTYTGLAGWLNPGQCNGLIVAGNTTTVASGSGTATVGGASCAYVDSLRQLAVALGNLNATSPSNTNHVIAAFTAGNPGAGVQAQLEQNISLVNGVNRFLVMSANSAAMNCGAGAPKFGFDWSLDRVTWNRVGGAGTSTNGCTTSSASTVSIPALGLATSTTAKVGTVYSPGSFLVNNPSIAVRVSNENGSGVGNDAAWDDLTVWDATPTLDKSFSPTTISANGVSTLTLTITNTTELAQKNGWSFTDNLPTGVKVAGTPTISTTCATGTTVTAAAGSGTITVTGGNLTAGMGSCFVKVNVTAAADGSYTNGASNIDPKVGMIPPSTDSTLTVFTPAPKLSMTKVASPTTVTAAGQTVNYTITATNSGNVALTNVSVSDTKVASLTCSPTIPVASLAIGASISCQGSYVATQVNVDSGSIANTATGSASSSAGAVSGTASATVTATRSPALSLTKSVTPTGFTNAGDTLNYTITATNTGNVSLTNATISDPKVSSLNCTPSIPVAKLAPAAQIVCTGSRTVTPADATAGVVTNTATATGTPPTGSAITATGSATATGLPKNPQLTVTKTASPTAMTTVGQPITYTITAKNTGDIELTNVTVEDPKVSGLVCSPSLPVATLPIGSTIACQGAHTVTQGDLDGLTLPNTATASGSSTIGPATGTQSATVTTAATPALTVAKTVSPTSFLLAGEVLSYQIRVTNTGNVTVSNVTVTDPKVTGLTCTPTLAVAALAPGAQIVCTGSRVVTTADVIAGSVVNTATASGTSPTGVPVTGTGTATSTGAPQLPKLDLTKSALPVTFSRAGDRVSYTLVALNSGNVPLTNVTVTDASAGTLSCTPALPVASLAAGDAITCLGSAVATQADVDAGSILNTATAAGTAPLGGPVNDSASVTVPGPVAEPRLSLAKSASPATYAAAGDTLTYTLVATNTGNVTLTNVTVADPGVAALSCAPALPVASLAPAATITCTGTRAVTQAEVDGGTVENTATASGNAPGGAPVPASASNVVVGLPAVPRLSIVKSASSPTFAGVDSELSYTLTLSNIGTATLKDLTVSDTLGTPSCTPTLAGLQLAPGEHAVCTYTHTVTGLEATVGHVDNTASASGSSLSGVPTSDQATLVTPGPVPAPQLSVSKTAHPALFAAVGDEVAFTIITTNTGNVPLADVTVTDDGHELSCDTALPVAELAVGASIRCSAPHVVTQADVDRGTLANTASASGDDLLGNPVDGADATTLPGPAARPALALTKRASVGSVGAAGEVIRYTFELTNTGNVTITDVAVNDPLVSDVACGQQTLAPGMTTSCSALHVVTQADLDGGSLVNVATATGTPARGSLSPAIDSVVVSAERRPSMAVTKSVLPVTFHAVGDRLAYTVVVINTGNVTLSDVSVSDPLLADISCVPAAPVAQLPPGASVLCTGSYEITQTDVDAGSVGNTASASASSPLGPLQPESASVDVPGPVSAPQLSLSKVATQQTYAVPGDVLTFTLVATNTGNVSLSKVSVTDPQLSDLSCSKPMPASLLPGAQVTCTGSYVVTQADVDGGSVTNEASASGTARGGVPVSGTAATTVDGIPPVPRLSVLKSASPSAFATTGDRVTWTITIRNVGLATLHDVEVSDSMGTPTCGVTVPVPTLAPGEAVTCSLETVASAEDVERGTLINTAGASATGPGGSAVSASDTLMVDGPVPAPRLTVVKTASPDRFTAPGETVVFTIVATNTGNVPLDDVSVSDPGLDLECSATLPVNLDLGESVTCTASRVTTLADVDAGGLRNLASGSGTTPLGRPISADAVVDVPGPVAAPALALVKSASVAEVSTVGQVITFSFRVTNIGNVTVHDAAVVDPELDAPAVCLESVLRPGESTTCTGPYTVRSTDLDGFGLANSATVEGQAARGSTRSAAASAAVPVDPAVLPPTGGGGSVRWAVLLLGMGFALVGASRRPRRSASHG